MNVNIPGVNLVEHKKGEYVKFDPPKQVTSPNSDNFEKWYIESTDLYHSKDYDGDDLYSLMYLTKNLEVVPSAFCVWPDQLAGLMFDTEAEAWQARDFYEATFLTTPNFNDVKSEPLFEK